jgi:hypothetical protein
MGSILPRLATARQHDSWRDIQRQIRRFVPLGFGMYQCHDRLLNTGTSP